MDIRDALIIMRLHSFVEGAKRAGQQAIEGEPPNHWMAGYTNAMQDVLDHFDILRGLSQKVDEVLAEDSE